MLSSIVTILSLGALAVQAAPLSNDQVGSSAFSVPAVKNPNYVRNGTASLLKAYAKHHITPTKDLSPELLAALKGKSLKKRQDGTVTATPNDGEEFLCPVSIGGQTLNLDFDTGSADLWVFSSLQPSTQRGSHSYYTSSKSSTFKALSGYTWKIEYADESGASGSVGTDTVTVGRTTVKGQAVELAKTVSSEFISDAANDGLLGLAFSSINTVYPEQQSTFFENAQPSLDSPLFAAYLPASGDGTYDFGATDSSKYTGTIQYVPVDSSNGFWEYTSTKYKVGSATYSLSGVSAISDTGTTLLLMPDAAVDNYYGQVSGATFDNSQGGYTFDCSATLPALTIYLGSNAAVIPGSSLNFGDAGNGACFGSLQSSGDDSMSIFGDVFFNNFYGIFDASGPQFGFAPIA
ncbi:hypothetical protein B7494_g7154 [Chlorociboria aeruginascens]|nr:hypothetical protein B7494_g7154 [Chlorociboria aeruginascens]